MTTPYADGWTHCSARKRVITNKTGEHTCKPLPPRHKRLSYSRAMREFQQNGAAECKADVAQFEPEEVK